MSNFNRNMVPPQWLLTLLAIGAVVLVGLILFAVL